MARKSEFPRPDGWTPEQWAIRLIQMAAGLDGYHYRLRRPMLREAVRQRKVAAKQRLKEHKVSDKLARAIGGGLAMVALLACLSGCTVVMYAKNVYPNGKRSYPNEVKIDGDNQEATGREEEHNRDGGDWSFDSDPTTEPD